MPHTFRDNGHHARIVGQDGILHTGWQPAPGGLPTRRRMPICPTILAKFQASGKICGIGQECLRHGGYEGRVMAPSEAEETSAQYLAKTPVL